MIISIAGIAIISAVITVCGYLLTLYYAKDADAPFLAGCSFPMGAMYYIAFFVIINRSFTGSASHILPLAALVITASVVSFAGGLKFLFPKINITQTWTCISILSLTIVFSCIRSFRDLYYDTPIHFQFAAEIAAGKFPVALPGAFDAPFPYHSGYDILFGSIAALTGGNFVDVYLFITVLFVFSIVMLLFSLINAMTSRGVFSAAGVFIVMLGTGLLGFAWHDIAIYYRLFDMLQQHPWKFAAFIAILIIAVSRKRGSINMKRFFILFVPLLPFTAHFSGQVIPFAFSGVLALYVFNCRGLCNRRYYLKMVAFALLLGICAAAMLYMGGLFEKSSTGNFGTISYSFQSVAGFFKIHDAHNGTAGRYYFLDTMFALAGYLFLAVMVWKKARAQGFASIKWQSDGAALSIGALGFLWYLSPLFLRYAVFWDNFCKFNYIGIIIGMLCFVFMAYRLYVSGKYMRIAAAGLAVYVLCLLAMQIGYVFSEGGNIWEIRNDLERYQDMIHSVRMLNADEGLVTYGVPEPVSFRLGVNLLNSFEADGSADHYMYHPLNRYEYLPHDIIPDIHQLAAAGVRYVVVANQAFMNAESLLPPEAKQVIQGGGGLWAIYELPAS